jgi:hypothetical protein
MWQCPHREPPGDIVVPVPYVLAHGGYNNQDH